MIGLDSGIEHVNSDLNAWLGQAFSGAHTREFMYRILLIARCVWIEQILLIVEVFVLLVTQHYGLESCTYRFPAAQPIRFAPTGRSASQDGTDQDCHPCHP